MHIQESSRIVITYMYKIVWHSTSVKIELESEENMGRTDDTTQKGYISNIRNSKKCGVLVKNTVFD